MAATWWLSARSSYASITWIRFTGLSRSARNSQQEIFAQVELDAALEIKICRRTGSALRKCGISIADECPAVVQLPAHGLAEKPAVVAEIAVRGVNGGVA